MLRPPTTAFQTQTIPSTFDQRTLRAEQVCPGPFRVNQSHAACFRRAKTRFLAIKSLAIVTAVAFIATSILGSQSANAQAVNTTIQLPTLRVTQFNSSFSVPDGGTINLGSIGRSGSAFGRRSSTSGGAQVSPRILVNRESERRFLSAATAPTAPQLNPIRRGAPGTAANGPLTHQQLNGGADVQAKADFLSRHINRSR